MDRLSKTIATFFGLGYIPVAPGTFGALGGMVISLVIMSFHTDSAWWNGVHLVMSAAAYFAGVMACRNLESSWGHDPSRVVIDEALGFWISILFLPQDWRILAAGFVLFRFFDILKPLGIRKVDKLQSHHAVMADDVIAGIYANIVLQVVVRIWGPALQ